MSSPNLQKSALHLNMAPGPTGTQPSGDPHQHSQVTSGPIFEGILRVKHWEINGSSWRGVSAGSDNSTSVLVQPRPNALDQASNAHHEVLVGCIVIGYWLKNQTISCIIKWLVACQPWPNHVTCNDWSISGRTGNVSSGSVHCRWGLIMVNHVRLKCCQSQSTSINNKQPILATVSYHQLTIINHHKPSLTIMKNQ